MKKQFWNIALGLLLTVFATGQLIDVWAEGQTDDLPPGGGGATTSASVVITEGDWTFKRITSAKTVTTTITTYSGKSKAVVVAPSVLGGAKVTAIGPQAFGHHNEIAAVYVPDTVATVDEWAFYDLNTATVISFANPEVKIKDGAFMSCGNVVLYLPSGTAQQTAGGKKVVTQNTAPLSVGVVNPQKAAIAGGNYLKVTTVDAEIQISSAAIVAIASGTFTQETNSGAALVTLNFSGADYQAVEKQAVIAENLRNQVQLDELNKTFRVLSSAEAQQLKKSIENGSYSDVKHALVYTEGYYVNGNPVNLDPKVTAYDVATGAVLYGGASTEKTLPNANSDLYYQAIDYRDSDRDGDIDLIYYSPYRLSYQFDTVNIASTNSWLNGLSARTTLNPGYLAFANAVLKAKGTNDNQTYSSLNAATAKSGDPIGARSNQERSVLWATDYGTITVGQLQANSTAVGNWAKMSYESGLSTYNTELVMEWGMNAVLYATNGGVVKVGSSKGKRSRIFANGDGANGVLAGGTGTAGGTRNAKSETAKVFVTNADFTLEGWNNHVADVVYGGYAYLEDVKATTGKPGSYAVGQGSALANDFGNGVVEAKQFHATVYGNRSAGVYVIGGGVITAQDSSFTSKIDAGLVIASGGTLRMENTTATGQMALRGRGGVVAKATSVFKNVTFNVEKQTMGYVTGKTASQAVQAWQTATGGNALSHYLMSDATMTLGRLCSDYGISQSKAKNLLATLGKLAGKVYTEKTLVRNSVLDNTFYNYSAGRYMGETDFTEVPYLTTGSAFGGLVSSVFEFESAGVTLELEQCRFKNANPGDYRYLVASEAGSAPVLHFNQSDASGLIWNEGEVSRAVEGREGKRSSALTVRFSNSVFNGSFADGSNGLWKVNGLAYQDNSGAKSNLNGNYYNAKANWGITASFDQASTWMIQHDSYLGQLTLEAGATVKAPAGYALQMTVDGKELPIKAGTYKGQIVIRLVKANQ